MKKFALIILVLSLSIALSRFANAQYFRESKPATVYFQHQSSPIFYDSWDAACFFSAYVPPNQQIQPPQVVITAATGGWGPQNSGSPGSPGCFITATFYIYRDDGDPNGPPNIVLDHTETSTDFGQNIALPYKGCEEGWTLDGNTCWRLRTRTKTSDICYGNPIFPGAAAKGEREVDFSYNFAGREISFEREYSSWSPSRRGGMLGLGWFYSRFERQLRFETSATAPTKVLVALDARSELVFEPVSGAWTTQRQSPFRLTKLANGWQLLNLESADIDTFDSNGSLLSVQIGGTRPITINRQSTPPFAISTLVDSLGRQASFSNYGAIGPAQMNDVANNSFAFQYNSAATSLERVTSADQSFKTYSYTSVNSAVLAGGLMLASVAQISSPSDFPGVGGSSFADTADNSFGGHRARPLSSIQDERGVAVSSFSYDVYSGKAISTQRSGGVLRYQFNYDTPSYISITDPLGSVHNVVTADLGNGVTAPTSYDQPAGAGCAAASKSITYDARANVTGLQDFSGNWSCNAYNALDLETIRAEGLTSACPAALSAWTPAANSTEKKISTQWHPDWRMKVAQAQPKLITRWIYNGQSYNGVVANCAPATALVAGKPLPVVCRVIEQATTDLSGALGLGATVLGAARETTYTYDKYGQVLTMKGPRADLIDLTTYTYYTDTDPDVKKRANLATMQNSVGHVTTYGAYNGYGQPLSIVEPNGSTVSMTYDLRRRLKTVVRYGLTTAYTYDLAGKITSVVLPDGSGLTYAYDAAHWLTSITDNAGNTINYTRNAMGDVINEGLKDSGGLLRRQITRVNDALNRVQSVTGAAQ